MAILPFAEWLPDRAALGNPGSTVATNVIPTSADTYGPFGDFTSYSDALTARCQGATAERDKDGNVYNLAGDASKLYSMTNAVWSDVSRTAGYTIGAEETWRFCNYAGRIIATNFADDVQTYVLGSSSKFAALSSGAPRARHAQIVDPGFLMLGNTYDSTDGNVPNRVWWSAYQDPTSFPTIGSASAQAVQSDFNDLPTGGWVQGIIGAVGGAAGAIFCDTCIYRLDYSGPPTVFQFTAVERARGTPAPNSIINLGPFAAYLGEDGFYLFDGQQSRPIGNGKVDKTFYADLNQSYFHRIYGAADPINKLLFWAYPSTSSAAGDPDTILVHNWEKGRWTKISMSCEFLLRSLSVGYTLETLDNTGYTVDTLPFSLDSRVWTGGRIILAAFSTAHKLGFFTGSNLQASVETGDSYVGDLVYCDGARILVDGGSPTLSIGYRNNPGDSIAYTTATNRDADGINHQTISARFMRGKVVIPSGSSWTHATGIDPVIVKEGGR